MTDTTHPASTDSPAEGGADPGSGRWYAAEDIDRMVRDIDVAMNGEGAARQAKLCDIYGQIIALTRPAPIEPGVREKVGWVSEWTGLTGILARAFHMTEEDARANAEWMHGRFYAVAELSSNTGEG